MRGDVKRGVPDLQDAIQLLRVRQRADADDERAAGLVGDRHVSREAVPVRQEADPAYLRRYDGDMGDTVYLQRVREDIEGASKSGVRSTPTFFVNGEIHDVSFGLEGLFASVEAALAKERG